LQEQSITSQGSPGRATDATSNHITEALFCQTPDVFAQPKQLEMKADSMLRKVTKVETTMNIAPKPQLDRYDMWESTTTIALN